MTDSSPNHKTVVRGNDERPGKPRVRKRGQPAVYYEIAGPARLGPPTEERRIVPAIGLQTSRREQHRRRTPQIRQGSNPQST